MSLRIPLAGRAYRLVLHLYDSQHREAYAVGMAQTFDARMVEARSRGRLQAAWVFFRETMGATAGAARDARLRRRGRNAQRRTGPKHRPDPLDWLRDLAFAARRLAAAPGFALASVLTLGLGIGANSAIFSVVHGIALEPLPYPDADRIVWVDHSAAGIDVDRGLGLTSGLYLHYRELSRTLQDIAIFRRLEVTVTGEEDPIRVPAAMATASLHEVLGIPPLYGRWFLEDDRYASGSGVAVLSHSLWTRRYGSDPAIIGRTIPLNGRAHEVVGIMPAGFAFPDRDTEVWIPRVIRPNRFGGFSDLGVARLESGNTPAEAQRELAALIPRLPESFNEPVVRNVIDDARLGSVVITLKDHVVGDVERTLWVLLGTVGFVLLIACANVANLFLVRAEARQREVAVRTALGASRLHVVRFFLAESVLLGALGAAVGLGLAFAGVEVLVAAAPRDIPRLDAVGVDATVIGVTGLVALAASGFFGLLPLLRRHPAPADALKESGRTSTAGARRMRARHTLAIAQIALALVLLVGSGLMLRSFSRLRNVDPGFVADDVLTFQLALPNTSYPSWRSAAAFYQTLIERVAGLPGVESVGAVSCLPLSGWCGGDPLIVEGRPPEPGVIPPIVALRTASAGYFETAGIPLRGGRTLERSDHEQLTGAVVVSQELAAQYWPNEDPIGRRIYPGGPEDSGNRSWYTVVGVVADVPARSLTTGGDPTIYFPMDSRDQEGYRSPHDLVVVLRTTAPAGTYVDAVRELVWALDANLPVTHVRTLDRLLADASLRMAFTMFLLVVAASVALTLGSIGVYGVIAYAVAQRRGEFGVRIALGARGRDISLMVLGESLALAGTGVALGLAGAFGLTRLMDALLFGVAPTDPLTYAAVSLLLMLVVTLASYLPARRAARVPPMETLRAE